MNYSIIIPAWNEEAYIGQTLESARAVMQAVDAQGVHHGELIVVDNNSSDNTALIAEQSGAIVVFEAINQIARARNAGASVASGDAFIFLDADTSCSETLLSNVLTRLSTDTVVGGGSIIVADEQIPASALRAINGWNWLSQKAKLAAGCFVFCRRDAFEAIGGFSVRVYAGEELLLSRRLKRWAKKRRMSFDVLAIDPVITSARKLQWYSRAQIFQQMLLLFIPGAVFSKRLCKTWYDAKAPRRR